MTRMSEAHPSTREKLPRLVQVRRALQHLRIQEFRAATADEKILVAIAVGVEKGAGTILICLFTFGERRTSGFQSRGRPR
jgi:hypothetical protein